MIEWLTSILSRFRAARRAEKRLDGRRKVTIQGNLIGSEVLPALPPGLQRNLHLEALRNKGLSNSEE